MIADIYTNSCFYEVIKIKFKKIKIELKKKMDFGKLFCNFVHVNYIL